MKVTSMVKKSQGKEGKKVKCQKQGKRGKISNVMSRRAENH